MQAATTKPRIWIGHWLMAVAALHTVFAAVVFGKTLRTMVERGLFNSVGADPLLGAVTWFVLFGFVLALLALAVTALERSGQYAALRKLGFGLLLLTLLGLVLMPASGFWLAIPAAVALLRGRAGAPASADTTSVTLRA